MHGLPPSCLEMLTMVFAHIRRNTAHTINLIQIASHLAPGFSRNHVQRHDFSFYSSHSVYVCHNYLFNHNLIIFYRTHWPKLQWTCDVMSAIRNRLHRSPFGFTLDTANAHRPQTILYDSQHRISLLYVYTVHSSLMTVQVS